jgi:NhaB family Na+:H+ antiporter
MDARMRARLLVQLLVGIILILALAFHVAEVGLIGLMIIIILGAFNGVTDEHHFGEAFTDGLPFTGLLVVFFSVVAVIHDQHLFAPVVDMVLRFEGQTQLVAFFIANGVLSAISDNVFVATVYISEIAAIKDSLPEIQYEKLAVAINMGTNIPSVSTPNGQAAFLFLLTSAIAPLVKLSYMQMVKLALPYAIIMTAVGLAATAFLL